MKQRWYELIARPIVALAPMHGFTDSAFRLKCRRAGADAVYSEMVAAEAIIRRVPKALEMMAFQEEERPIIIQIFGNSPQNMAKAAKIIEREFRPDGIDINFGCPVQKAAKQGFGAIQTQKPDEASEIVRGVSRSVEIPVSVKTRLSDKTAKKSGDFVELMFQSGAKLVAIHGRTPTQKYRGSADWKILYEIKERLADKVILGSGDIRCAQDLKDKIGNLDGVLIGRAAKRDPEIFRELKAVKGWR